LSNEEKLHELVELIVARLTSHPEELKKWKGLIDGNKQYFTKEENEALRVVEREAALGESHKHMMRTILQADEPKPEPKKSGVGITSRNLLGSWEQIRQQQILTEEQHRHEMERLQKLYEMDSRKWTGSW